MWRRTTTAMFFQRGLRRRGNSSRSAAAAKVGQFVERTLDGQRMKKALPEVKGRVATIAFGARRFTQGIDAGIAHLHGTARPSPRRKARLGGQRPCAALGLRRHRGKGSMFVIIGDVDLYAEKQRVSWRAATSDGATFAFSAHHTARRRRRHHRRRAGHRQSPGRAGTDRDLRIDGLAAWQRREAPPTEDFQRIVWTGQRFLVSGGKTAWSSPDGLAWAVEPRGIPCSLAWAREPDVPLGIGFSWGGAISTSPPTSAAWKKIAPSRPALLLEAVAFRP